MYFAVSLLSINSPHVLCITVVLFHYLICLAQVNITVKEDKPGAAALKEMLRTRGADLIREKLAAYVDKLKSGMSCL